MFYVRNGIEEDVIGGWGYLLSDDGSGVWIGQQALRHMMRVFERLEEPGLLHAVLREEYGIESRAHLYDAVYYRQKAPVFQIGSYCKAVSKAARGVIRQLCVFCGRRALKWPRNVLK